MTCYATGGSVTINGASAKAGDEVTVSIAVSGIKGVNSGSIEVKSLPKGVTVIGGEWSKSPKIADFATSLNKGVFAFDASKDIDGTIFKLKLKLEATAESGDIVCALRFKDISGEDIQGIETVPGKLTVLSEDSNMDGTGEDNGEDGKEGGEENKLSPVVIVLIAVAGTALVAAIVLIITKKKK